MEEARARFALRLRALKDASGLSVRALTIASARTPRRRAGQEPIRLRRSTVDGMISQSRPVRPERHNFEVFVDTCIRVAAETARVLPEGLGDRDAWDAAYRVLREETDDREHLRDAARAAPRSAAPPPPYRGLEAFGPADAAYFFGRDELTAALLDRIAGAGGVLIVMGPSGSGKSSLLRAGLVPALTRDAATAPVVFTPGADAWPTLCELAGTGHDVAPESLSRRLGSLWSGRAVVVDQFEEVFTGGQESGRGKFVEVVTALGADAGGPLVVVLGVRADFLGHCVQYPELVAAVERPVAVTPMTRENLLEVIRGPARVAGLTLQDGLAELLLEDLRSDRDHAGAVGVLPLLSHALRETWAHREGTNLTLAGYRASGGIVRSLAQTADATVNALDPTSRRTARRLLTRLVHLGVDTADTARRMPLAELPADPLHQEVLDRLAQARLVTVDASTVQITHEALIRGWPRLRTWVEEDRADLVVLQRLDLDAAAWDQGGRDAAYLYSGNRLQTARDAYDAASWAHPASDARTRAFLAASERAAAEARRAAARLRWVGRAAVVMLTVLTLTATAAGVLATRSAGRAEAQRREAVSRLLTARGEVMRTADPILSGLLSAAAWRYTPTDEARYGMLAALATPLDAVLNSPSAEVTAVAVSPDGRTLATGDMEGKVRLWDAAGRPKGAPLTGHASGVYPIVFSPDGSVIASGDGDEEHDGVVLIRDAATGRPLTAPLTGHKDALSAIVFSRDGATLTTADGAQIVQRWSTRTWRRVGPAIGPLRKGREVWTRLSPDGSALAVQTDHSRSTSRWQVWDLATRRPYGPPILAGEMAFSPDGQTIMTSNDNLGEDSGLIQQWDLTTYRKVGEAVRAGTSVYAMTYSPDGRTVAVGGGDGVVRFLDARTRRPAGAVLRGHDTFIVDLAYSADGTRLVTTAGERNARVWDTTVWAQVPGPTPAVESVSGAAISGDGRVLAVRGWTSDRRLQGSVRVLDAATGHPTGDPVDLGSTDLFSVNNDIALGRDGRLLVAGVPRLTQGEEAVTIDGTRLVVMDLATRRPVSAIDRLPDSFRAIAVSRDDSVIATSGERITLRGTTTLRQIAASPPLSFGANAMAFAPDGRAIMTAETNGADTGALIRVLRTSDLAQIGNPFPAPASVTAMTVSGDGAYLATGDSDGTLRLWDVRSRRQIAVAPPAGRTERPASLTFTPDGATVLAVARDGSVRRWPLRLPSDPYRAMCAVAGRSLTWQEWNQFLPGGEPYTATCP
ncbi:AAA family ATPase [Sphaerisporangium sp. NPDC005289]|uniref:NACHT and WD repeat domain-containing protein n=1 Tax=Sphaerisporangium sp. NPDC005289 TaxID=3155247 RepID=UPI0033A42AB2